MDRRLASGSVVTTQLQDGKRLANRVVVEYESTIRTSLLSIASDAAGGRLSWRPILRR
jgi:hypothetical protein